MTLQIVDTCIFQGRKWGIKSWDGNRAAIPSNEQLDIETKGENSANWSGRIDHFIVYRNKLYLLKIEINPEETSQFKQPNNAMREVVIRYENRWSGTNGKERVVREHRFEYLVFHDLFVSFTGDLFLNYPFYDSWEQPVAEINLEDDVDSETESGESQRLVFRKGYLIGY